MYHQYLKPPPDREKRDPEPAEAIDELYQLYMDLSALLVANALPPNDNLELAFKHLDKAIGEIRK
jgi:hypothetical protein